MTEPTDPVTAAILQLEAEARALRVVLGLVLAESPAGLRLLQQIVPHLETLGLNVSLTDGQLIHLNKVVLEILEQAQTYREKSDALAKSRESPQ